MCVDNLACKIVTCIITLHEEQRRTQQKRKHNCINKWCRRIIYIHCPEIRNSRKKAGEACTARSFLIEYRCGSDKLSGKFVLKPITNIPHSP